MDTKETRLFCFLFISALAEFVQGDISYTYYNLISREDPCIALCDKAPLSLTNSKYVKSCCQRGCRFFNLVDLRNGFDTDGNLNSTRDACEASCSEAYSTQGDRFACSTGCDFMARQRVADLMLLFSIAVYMDEADDSTVLLMSPDIPENDILTDPGLKKELLPGWWDSNGFKLPQTYIRTVPVDSGTVDYGLPSDYSGESEQTVSVSRSDWLPGSDWLQCASRHTGIPRWLLASAIAVAALSALWLCLSPEKFNDPKQELITEKGNVTHQITVFLPEEEAPLYKKAPPKYNEVVDTSESSDYKA